MKQALDREPLVVRTIAKIIILAGGYFGLFELTDLEVEQALGLVATAWLAVEALVLFAMRNLVRPTKGLPEEYKSVYKQRELP